MFIDVDRHILSEIVINNKFIKKQLEGAGRTIDRARDAHERNIALILHLVGEIKEIETGKGKEAKKEAGEDNDT